MPATKKKKKAPKKEKTMVSLKAMLDELGMDPKKARTRLRKEGHSATEGRYPDMEIGSKLYEEFLEILS